MKKIFLAAVLIPMTIMTAGVCMTMYNANKEKTRIQHSNNNENKETPGTIMISTPVSIKISGQPVYLSMTTNRQTVFLKV